MQHTGYYDMHIHLLPGVDDGSQSMEMTKEMLARAYEQGVRHIIATPHYNCGKKNVSVEERKQLLEKVREEAAKIGNDLEISLGNELFYSRGILEALSRGEALTMCGSRYVLVEFYPSTEEDEIFRAMKNFLRNGYKPILAHVERYQCMMENEENIDTLLELGVLLQMNAKSLMGGMFDGRAKQCRRLFVEGKIHLLGSDAHGMEHRPPIMEDVVKFLEKKKVNETLLEKVLFKNPEKYFGNK